MRSVADDNPSADLLVRVLTFSSTARWLQPTPTPINDFRWQPVQTDGATNLGEALKLVARSWRCRDAAAGVEAVLALVWTAADGRLAGGPARGGRHPVGARAVRVAIAIGKDADRAQLKEFLGNPELEPLDADSPKKLAAAIRWASTVALKAASTPLAQADSAEGGYGPYAPPPVAADDDDDDVW
ncbi:vWA domain-containing protein [Kitasatospora cheerisanensis]|uniref:Uncharacterized protein n=1 Tax=Kitasatospora cheerisanensis KCTC 2395 TaxID=1348663 RepID=A0A066Z3M5_9ACTN|nr:tellurium resistance protein [Kitasatospora cheerisanensis]KDN86844.1 hypothetical protein KCH_12900 [Kitasatospora cheerisanensis KCTC 2395]